MDGRGGSDRDAVTITVDDFTPQDMTWNTPGTYTFNVGGANVVYISGRGADGGGGGGGGGGAGRFNGSGYVNEHGGAGGSGGPGADGQRGGEGERDSDPDSDRRGGGGGGGGEAGADGGFTGVRQGSATLITMPAGLGGSGGRGGNGGGYTHADGGDGGDGGVGATSQVGGGAGGMFGARGPGGGAQSGANGHPGGAGSALGEMEFTVASNTVLTIIVGAPGVGGVAGGGGRVFHESENGKGGTDGSPGTIDGSITIRTARHAPAPQNLNVGTPGETSVGLSWDEVSNTSKYRVEYRRTTAESWTTDDDTLITTSHTVDGLTCGTEYQFRVSAYGNGTFYAAEWSNPSAAVSATTVACTTPQDMTFSTLGTYILTIGKGNLVYISGRGADGGGGGGGGGGTGSVSYEISSLRGTGGTGGPGEDGRNGTLGDEEHSTISDYSVHGGNAGGGGEAGGRAGDTVVKIGSNTLLTLLGGAGGDGGKGGDGQYGQSVVQGVSNASGGDGGRGGRASVEGGYTEGTQTGGVGGIRGESGHNVTNDQAVAGSNGWTGQSSNEIRVVVPEGTVVTIVIGAGGEGGGGGGGGSITRSSFGNAVTSTADDGGDGADGTPGSIRIRTARHAPAPQNLSVGTPGETSVSLSWDEVSNTSKYRVEYRLATSASWTTDDDTLTTISHTVDGLTCGTEYQFRVSAYGNGTFYAAEWSNPSATASATTAACS